MSTTNSDESTTITDQGTGECPVCDNPASLVSHGVVAPFVGELCGMPIGSPSRYRRCPDCELLFFDRRYTDAEMAALYGQYRSSSYSRCRRRWEPWYSRRVNDAYSPGEVSVLADRRAFMASVLDEAGLPDQLELVVDFGGDEGQFFPETATARRVVCDVSDHDLPPGVERVHHLTELGSARSDLVIVAHVLEHLVDPLGTVDAIRASMAADGVLYIEVPLDGFTASSAHGTARYERYLRWLSSHRPAFILADFVTGLSRQYFKHVPRCGVVKASEHINYFSPSSLRSLLTKAGLKVVAERAEPQATVGGMRIGRYGLAARA